MPSTEGHRIVCLPITLHALMESVGKREDTTEYESRITASRNLVLWVICFDGDERICIDIHLANHENN